MTRLAGIPLPTLILLILAAALAFYAPKDAPAVDDSPPPFEPGGIACLENFETPAQCDGNPAPGASSDIRGKFCTGWNNDCTIKDSPVVDSNFGVVVSFVPPSFTVPKGDTLQIGALAGSLSADATLGLINNPCSAAIGVSFTLMNASINTSDLIEPKPVGEADVMEPLALDVNPQNGIPDGADHYPSFLAARFDPDFDFGDDEIPYTGDDSNGPLPTVQPRARLGGFTIVQGSWISLQFVFFEKGVTLEGPDDFITFNPDLGYPSVTVLQDPTVPAAQSSITDFCAPLRSQNVTFGLTRDNPCTPSTPAGKANCPGQTVQEERGYPLFPCDTGNSVDDDEDGKVNDGCPQVYTVAESGAQCDNTTSDDGEDSDVNDGCPVVGGQSEADFIPDPDGCDADSDEASCVNRANPGSAGDISISTFAASQRDADGDGIENSLDVCSLKPNGDWNPRNVDPTNDSDNDGLPNECDPKPNNPSPPSSQSCPKGFTGADEDGDCMANRADNCPLINQLANPADVPGLNNRPATIDAEPDGIGDACDVKSGGDPLFGNSQNGPDDEDGGLASKLLKFPASVAAGASTAPQPPTIVDCGTGSGQDLIDCGVATATTPAGDGDATPTPTPTPAPTADDDNDGVLNATDRCPGTPAGATVDEFGCTPTQAPQDDDGDGVRNVDDTCPNTPKGETVDEKGCSASQLAGAGGGGTGGGTRGGTGGGTGGGAAGGAETGVGALAPAVSSIPAWGAIASALGGAGLLGSLGVLAARVFRRRQD